MFEECFSMIDFDTMADATKNDFSDAAQELDFDDLQSLLVSALDEALNRLDEEFLVARTACEAEAQ
jgi:hypothetical protein